MEQSELKQDASGLLEAIKLKVWDAYFTPGNALYKSKKPLTDEIAKRYALAVGEAVAREQRIICEDKAEITFDETSSTGSCWVNSGSILNAPSPSVQDIINSLK